jgi:tetratricopeptide (TPR) repeat protein
MSTPDDPKLDLNKLLQQAHALIDRRRFARARQILAEALQSYPDHVDLLYLLAFVDHSENQTASAEKTVNAVLTMAPRHYGARTLRAALCEEQKRYAEAEATWIDLLHDYPEQPDCYAGYADLMLKTLNLEKAQRLTQEGLRITPDHSRCLFVACLIR